MPRETPAFDNRLADDRYVAGLLRRSLYEGRTLAFYADLYAKVEALTPAAIQSAVEKHLDPGRMVTVKSGDMSVEAAPEPAAAAAE